jgi:predicted metalloprotease with PDZ domain
MLALIGHTVPEMRRAFGKLPQKILIVIGPEPMWRGGLSGPDSLFMHADRPLISENGTSTLLHELTHVITRIRGSEDEDDWIAEGLAEYYGLELLRRSGGLTQARFDAAMAWQQRWGRKITSLRKPQSRGPTTARAVVLFGELDRELRAASLDEHSLDDLLRLLRKRRSVSTEELIKLAEDLADGPLESLDTPLLRKP